MKKKIRLTEFHQGKIDNEELWKPISLKQRKLREFQTHKFVLFKQKGMNFCLIRFLSGDGGIVA